ncbi:MAG TPA: hypothetical protein VGO47_14830, partial [Chlamydiales bacterium]|nr:hypothetical protein [Chlamydiales bacterium]
MQALQVSNSRFFHHLYLHDSSPPKLYSANTATSTLRRHVQLKHSYKYVNLCREKGLTTRVDTVLKPSVGQDNNIHEPRRPFSLEAFKAALVSWMVT